VVALERRAPEARGRSERASGTLQARRSGATSVVAPGTQARLPKALELAGITTVDGANRFLRETYLPEHNSRSAVPPEHPETALVADRAGASTGTSCACRRSAWSATTTPCATAASACRSRRPRSVRVHDYPDGTLAIFHGPRCLARYRADGAPLDHHQPLAA
jgi:hypothetical protein